MKIYNPVIKYGEDKGLIEDTPEYYDFWQEQIRRSLEGYEGITGRQYFMLNFTKFKDLDYGWVNPDYLDYQDEFLQKVDYNDSIGRNTGMKKARRKGFTYVVINGVLIYDLIFNDAIETSWSVGDEKTLVTSQTMIADCMAHVHPFFYLNTLTDKNGLIQFGWEEPDEKGVKRQKGTGNLLYTLLMSADPEGLKGKALKRSVFEEIGKFKNLKECFNGTKDCWMKNGKQKGTAILGGTGGNVDKGSRDFMYMVQNPEEFNIDWYMVPATKGWVIMPGGKTDEEASMKQWNEQEKVLKNKKNKRSLYEFYQNNPIKDEHIFLNLGSGVFDQVLLENAERMITFKPQGLLQGSFALTKDWREIYNKDGWCKRLVEFIPDVDGKVLIKHLPDYLGDDISGVDAYGQEKSTTSDSEGAMYIYRKTSKHHQYSEGDVICMEYMDRPERISDFNKNVFYGCLFYDTTLNAEANMATELFNYYELKNAGHLIDARPQGHDVIKDPDKDQSKASNKYGRSINKATKPLLVNAIGEYIDEHYYKIWSPRLIKQLKFFGSMNTDLAMAFGIARLKALDAYSIKGIDFIQGDEEEPDLSTDLPFYSRVNGQIVISRKRQY